MPTNDQRARLPEFNCPPLTQEAMKDIPISENHKPYEWPKTGMIFSPIFHTGDIDRVRRIYDQLASALSDPPPFWFWAQRRRRAQRVADLLKLLGECIACAAESDPTAAK